MDYPSYLHESHLKKLNETDKLKVFIEFNTGKAECKILAISGPGTLDVERLSDGRCFRVTGLDLSAIKYRDLG